MRESARRLAAVVRADLLIRFRRVSTVVVFLLLSAFAWMWVPDPATGRTLLQLDGRRALYNSAAVGMATATVGAIFVGLFGFYVVSNTLRRDVATRCGFVIASTTMRSSEYLFGKFAGNLAFLTTFIAGFMVSSMAMLVVRGEAPLQPLLFTWQYVLLVPPAIVLVSALAVTFESIPALAGRFGDVLYFFLWIGGMSIVAIKGHAVAGYFDFFGVAFLFDSMTTVLDTTSMSIGQSAYDMAKPPFVFQGLPLLQEWIVPRIVSTFAPLSFLAVARVFFHRFDPSRVRASAREGPRNVLRSLQRMLKPAARIAWTMAPGSGNSLIAAARSDAIMTITAAPMSLLAAAVLAAATLGTNAQSFAGGVLPVAFAVAALFIADISCREARSGTIPLVFASPRLKASFVWWKTLSTTIVLLAIIGIPLLRAAFDLRRVPALLIGVAFIVAAATALGVLTSNPKTFIVLFLTFWYLVINDHGHTPALDFAGTSGVATPAVMLSYLGVTIAALASAHASHGAHLRRAY